MRGADGSCYEYILEYRAEEDKIVGLDGDAPVSVQGYDRYPVEIYCVSSI